MQNPRLRAGLKMALKRYLIMVLALKIRLHAFRVPAQPSKLDTRKPLELGDIRILFLKLQFAPRVLKLKVAPISGPVLPI